MPSSTAHDTLTITHSLLSFSVLGWLSYCLQRISLAGLPTRLLALSSISGLFTCLSAVLYRCASGQSWGQSLLKAYGVLFRAPGIGVMNEQSFTAGLVANIIFLFGLLCFATFLSMISDHVKQQLHAVRVGEVRLPLRNHIVVLNWNQQSLSLLKQLSNAQADSRSRLYKQPVVVLAEPSQASMDAAVAAVLKRSKLRVFCRSGRPAKARDLEMVAAEAADTVILLQPQHCSSQATADALKATALVSLLCLRERALSQAGAGAHGLPSRALVLLAWVLAAVAALCRRAAGRLWASQHTASRMRVLVQVQEQGSCAGSSGSQDVVSFLQGATAASRHSSDIQQVQLLSQSALDRLVCQTAAEPGVATVFREVVRAGGEVRLDWCDVTEQLAGAYGRATELLQECVLLGVLAADSRQLTMNPPDQLLLQPGDRLVGLTRKGMQPPRAATVKAAPARHMHRTVSRVSSMSSPQLCVASTRSTGSSGGGSACSGGGSSNTCSGADAAAVKRQAMRRGLQIIVLGWQEPAVPQLMQQLQDAAPLGSHITVLLPQTQPGAANTSSSDSGVPGTTAKQQNGDVQQQRQQQPQGVQQQGSTPPPSHCTVLRVSEPGSMQSFLAAGIDTADAVVLGPALSAAAAPASTEADALVTAGMLAIQQALLAVRPQQHIAALQQPTGPDDTASQGALRRLHVVAVVASYSVRRALQCFLSSVLLECGFSYEIMVLDEFAAGMLVSVAQDLSNALVLQSLLDQAGGQSLGMLTLPQLGLDVGHCQWCDVLAAARQLRCTALGYRRADGRMVLVPCVRGPLPLAADDRIVVVGGAHRRRQKGL